MGSEWHKLLHFAKQSVSQVFKKNLKWPYLANTLVELLIVMVMIGIMAAITIMILLNNRRDIEVNQTTDLFEHMTSVANTMDAKSGNFLSAADLAITGPYSLPAFKDRYRQEESATFIAPTGANSAQLSLNGGGTIFLQPEAMLAGENPPNSAWFLADPDDTSVAPADQYKKWIVLDINGTNVGDNTYGPTGDRVLMLFRKSKKVTSLCGVAKELGVAGQQSYYDVARGYTCNAPAPAPAPTPTPTPSPTTSPSPTPTPAPVPSASPSPSSRTSASASSDTHAHTNPGTSSCSCSCPGASASSDSSTRTSASPCSCSCANSCANSSTRPSACTNTITVDTSAPTHTVLHHYPFLQYIAFHQHQPRPYLFILNTELFPLYHSGSLH
ncbi:MAG: type II secretion system GspH family protein [Cyanobacteria bacterium]|nr:type II secretion system GspH family protein [Cyanobacteriota bacterium]